MLLSFVLFLAGWRPAGLLVSMEAQVDMWHDGGTTVRPCTDVLNFNKQVRRWLRKFVMNSNASLELFYNNI